MTSGLTITLEVHTVHKLPADPKLRQDLPRISQQANLTDPLQP